MIDQLNSKYQTSFFEYCAAIASSRQIVQKDISMIVQAYIFAKLNGMEAFATIMISKFSVIHSEALKQLEEEL